MYALTGITGQRDENRRHETNSADQQEIPETRHLRLSELKKRVLMGAFDRERLFDDWALAWSCP